MDGNIITKINETREKTILTYYNQAYSEIRSTIRSNPFITEFDISAGCISKEITDEICNRLNKEGLTSEVITYYRILPYPKNIWKIKINTLGQNNN